MKYRLPIWGLALVITIGSLLPFGIIALLLPAWFSFSLAGLILLAALVFGASWLSLHYMVYMRLEALYRRLLVILQRRSGTESVQNKDPISGLGEVVVGLSGNISREFREMREQDLFRKEYVAIVSHELKTPIFVIEGFLETLLDGALEDPKVNRRFLQQALNNVHRLNNLVQDLMIISRLESGEINMRLEHFQIYELVLDVFDDLKQLQDNRQLRNQVQISVVANNLEKAYVHADPERIRQVLVNLVANAIIHGRPEEGKVQVILENGLEDRIKIRIADNGAGIEEEHLLNIFDRFYRVEKSRTRDSGGSGLGLSIVKSLLEAHGENIYVTSELNVGTEFCFYLERYRPENPK